MHLVQPYLILVLELTIGNPVFEYILDIYHTNAILRNANPCCTIQYKGKVIHRGYNIMIMYG